MIKIQENEKVRRIVPRLPTTAVTVRICEFCESEYNESKTDECFQCLCMREGRVHSTMDTLRETIKESDKYWNEKTDLRTVGLTEREEE